MPNVTPQQQPVSLQHGAPLPTLPSLSSSEHTITVTATEVTVTNHANGAAFTLDGVYADIARRIIARNS